MIAFVFFLLLFPLLHASNRITRAIPQAVNSNDEPELIGLEEIGLIKERLLEAEDSGIGLQAVGLVTEQVSDDFFGVEILNFGSNFNDPCRFIPMDDCPADGSYAKEFSNSVREEFSFLLQDHLHSLQGLIFGSSATGGTDIHTAILEEAGIVRDHS